MTERLKLKLAARIEDFTGFNAIALDSNGDEYIEVFGTQLPYSYRCARCNRHRWHIWMHESPQGGNYCTDCVELQEEPMQEGQEHPGKCCDQCTRYGSWRHREGCCCLSPAAAPDRSNTPGAVLIGTALNSAPVGSMVGVLLEDGALAELVRRFPGFLRSFTLPETERK